MILMTTPCIADWGLGIIFSTKNVGYCANFCDTGYFYTFEFVFVGNHIKVYSVILIEGTLKMLKIQNFASICSSPVSSTLPQRNQAEITLYELRVFFTQIIVHDN